MEKKGTCFIREMKDRIPLLVIVLQLRYRFRNDFVINIGSLNVMIVKITYRITQTDK